MKLALISAAAIAVMGAANTAQAGEAYGTIGGALAQLKVDDFGVSLDSWAVQARLGYAFTENIAIEADGLIGVSDETVTDGADSASVGVDSSIGGYVVGRLPVSDMFNIFARVGYHTTSIGASGVLNGQNISDSDSFDGVAFGGGFEFFLDDANGVRADYTINDADGGSADVISLGYVRKF